MSPNECGV